MSSSPASSPTAGHHRAAAGKVFRRTFPANSKNTPHLPIYSIPIPTLPHALHHLPTPPTPPLPPHRDTTTTPPPPPSSSPRHHHSPHTIVTILIPSSPRCHFVTAPHPPQATSKGACGLLTTKRGVWLCSLNVDTVVRLVVSTHEGAVDSLGQPQEGWFCVGFGCRAGFAINRGCVELN
ncbi:hypothetical protein Tco_0522075 [Tanacetum coccineum]